LNLHETWRGEDIQGFLREMTDRIQTNDRIKIHLSSQIKGVDGFAGNFTTTIAKDGTEEKIVHGVVIIASGATEFKPDQYLYGQDERVVTGLELQKRFVDKDSSLADKKRAVFIQCVGSRIPERPYCSKICCTQSIKEALKLKELNPAMDISVLYRDMRPYGLREDLYREARSKGISFIRYDFDKDLTVERKGEDIQVGFTDFVLRRQMHINPDLLVLASAIVPEKDPTLAQLYKVPQNADGFFVEAHVKLNPVDFATDGVFLCGLAHSPKPLDEAITQAQAAAARAVTLLSAKTIPVSGTVAQVVSSFCSSCGVCVSICPYSAPRFNEKTGKAEVEPTLCKGCGLCVSSCRSGAIQLKGFDTPQIMAMIDSSLAG
jgi:heterodisulfide reductase subunit A